MRKLKNKKIVYIVILLAAALAFAAAVEATAFSRVSTLSKIEGRSSEFYVGAACADLSVKAQPSALSFSSLRVKKGEKIKIIAKDKKWCKIIVAANNRVQKGYVKTADIDNFEEGIIAISSIDIQNEIIGLAGDSVQIDTDITPVYSNEKIVWSSDNEDVAFVKDGVVTLNKKGSAVITAKASSCEASVSVTVLDSGSFNFSAERLTVDVDKGFSIERYLNASNKNVQYSVSNPDIAKIENGKFIPLAAGKTVLTATNGKETAQCIVNIRSVSKNAKSSLNLVNAYGNTYNFHPAALAFENGFGGYKYWVAFTPYENSKDYFENPHIMASNDLVDWKEPNGFKNPLEPVPDRHKEYTTYNSDTELVYNEDTKMIECWWRFYDAANKDVVLFRKTSKDGVHWSEKEQLFISPDMKFDFLSPSVIYENGIYRMWSINPHDNYALEYRESKNGEKWSTPRQIKFEYEYSDFYNWHMDIIHTPRGYEISMSGSSKNVRGHNDMPVFYSYSSDNVNYTKARPMLNPSVGTSNWDNRGLYRSGPGLFRRKILFVLQRN